MCNKPETHFGTINSLGEFFYIDTQTLKPFQKF